MLQEQLPKPSTPKSQNDNPFYQAQNSTLSGPFRCASSHRHPALQHAHDGWHGTGDHLHALRQALLCWVPAMCPTYLHSTRFAAASRTAQTSCRLMTPRSRTQPTPTRQTRWVAGIADASSRTCASGSFAFLPDGSFGTLASK